MDDPQLTSFVAPEGASPDVNGPVDRSRLASGWAQRPGAACKASAPFGRPGGMTFSPKLTAFAAPEGRSAPFGRPGGR